MRRRSDEGCQGKSWITTANHPECGFPLQNLPFCAFRTGGMQPHLGVGIGNHILDLNALSRTGLLRPLPWAIRSACRSTHLNSLMALGSGPVSELRARLIGLLSEEVSPRERDRLQPCLRPSARATLCIPVRVANYTDFYASIHHAANVGRLFRPDRPLLPNYKHVPIGYHGRASSLVISGTPVYRPSGQTKSPEAAAPSFGPSRQLDYELEIAAYIASGNPLGMSIPIAEADRRIFGYTLLNDWSARDIQSWEYQPLGPFLGKSFATSISPWVVTSEALAPYRTPLPPRPAGDPEPLPYLTPPGSTATGLDIQLEALLSTAVMRARSLPPVTVALSNTRDLYWSFAQMIAHHTSNGCNLLTGDLLASGTVSGSSGDALGCLLELTRRGEAPLPLPTGETRSFLEDGDEIILRGGCRRAGLPFLSLGECRGIVLPARI